MYSPNFICSFFVIVVNQFREYKEPDESDEKRPGTHVTTSASSKDEEDVLLPLDETILSNNLGLPIIVVATKVCYNLSLALTPLLLEIMALYGIGIFLLNC